MKNVFSPNQLVKTSTQLLWMLGDAMDARNFLERAEVSADTC